MFAPLATIDRDLAQVCQGLDAAATDPAQAADLIEALARIERRAAGARLLLCGRLDTTVTGDEGGPVRWLARRTGQSATGAARDLATSAALDDLAATRAAVAGGDLSPAQAHEVTTAATADPGAESALLATARAGSLAELRHHARRVRAAATDTEERARQAHARRDLSTSVDEEAGEGRLTATGPAAAVAELTALLEPWRQARFDQARRQGRRERRGAIGFDALLDALRHADAARRGHHGPAADDLAVPTGPPAKVLARVDVTALRRGRTVPGEICEIDGLGPVAVEDLRQLLPDAAIDLILTNGRDVFNVTHLGRRATAHQYVVLDWIGGQCTRTGCAATRHLQVDHRIDWAHTHLTELRALDWLCPADHRRKTHHGWALVEGTGRRAMVPPDHPDHPANGPPAEQAA